MSDYSEPNNTRELDWRKNRDFLQPHLTETLDPGLVSIPSLLLIQ